MLVEVTVRVSWLDLGVEKAVERVTSIFDADTALALGGEAAPIGESPPAVPGDSS